MGCGSCPRSCLWLLLAAVTTDDIKLFKLLRNGCVGLAAGWSRFLKNRQFLKKSVGDKLNLEPVNYNFELFTSGCRWMRWNKGKDNNSRNELKSRLGILQTDCSISSPFDAASNCSGSL